jgi:uncharacterized membrane protein
MGRQVRTGNPNLLFRDRVRFRAAPAAAVLLASCGTAEQSPTVGQSGGGQDESQGWSLGSPAGGARLVLTGASGEPQIRLICTSDGELIINVPTFRPIGSEERMTFGQGETVETFVADPAGDRDRGGVTASGPVPGNLEALISGRVAANYGAQNSGPHPPLPASLASGFASGCGSPEQAGQPNSPPNSPNEKQNAQSGNVSACLIQDGRRLSEMPLHAIGTEPFWAASVQGRCVTYSTPENQDGTRVWTQFSGSAENGTWRGALDERRFVMRTRPEQGCSDGMSDIRYPIAVTLTVMGEERRGCARWR